MVLQAMSGKTFLFAPGDNARKLERVADFGADAVILDLEDAVALSEKSKAREMARHALGHYSGVLRCVRVNDLATGLLHSDLDAVVCDSLDAVVLPMTESAWHVRMLHTRLKELERKNGLDVGSIGMLFLVETALGIAAVDDIAQEARLRPSRLLFGLGDYTADVGISFVGGSRSALLYARSRLVNASRAFGLGPPVDGPYTYIEDEDGLVEDTRYSRSLGFRGRVVVYPGQVQAVNDGYGIASSEEIDWARTVVDEFERAEKQGSAALRVNGMFIDYPVYYRALGILAEVGK